MKNTMTFIGCRVSNFVKKTDFFFQQNFETLIVIGGKHCAARLTYVRTIVGPWWQFALLEERKISYVHRNVTYTIQK